MRPEASRTDANRRPVNTARAQLRISATSSSVDGRPPASPPARMLSDSALVLFELDDALFDGALGRSDRPVTHDVGMSTQSRSSRKNGSASTRNRLQRRLLRSPLSPQSSAESVGGGDQRIFRYGRAIQMDRKGGIIDYSEETAEERAARLLRFDLQTRHGRRKRSAVTD